MILCKQKTVSLFFLVLLITLKMFGQDAHYSQFYANPLYLNPAFAGSNNCPRFALNFRDQWPAIKGNFIAFSGSYDQHINVLHGGIGVIASADYEGRGMKKSFNVSGIYNFRIKVSHKFNLQFALQGGFFNSVIDWTKFEFASGTNYPGAHIDGNIYEYKPIRQFDAAFGFVGYTSYLYFGMALHHLYPIKNNYLNIGSQKDTKFGFKYTAHIGGRITISQKMRAEVNAGDIFLYPNLVFISQGKFNYLHEGFYFNFYPFTIGAWVRHNFKNFDAVIISCGVEYKFLRVGYSYDFTLNQLEGTGGAHEVSLQFTIPCDNEKGNKMSKRKKMKMNYPPVECPKF